MAALFFERLCIGKAVRSPSVRRERPFTDRTLAIWWYILGMFVIYHFTRYNRWCHADRPSSSRPSRTGWTKHTAQLDYGNSRHAPPTIARARLYGKWLTTYSSTRKEFWGLTATISTTLPRLLSADQALISLSVKMRSDSANGVWAKVWRSAASLLAFMSAAICRMCWPRFRDVKATVRGSCFVTKSQRCGRCRGNRIFFSFFGRDRVRNWVRWGVCLSQSGISGCWMESILNNNSIVKNTTWYLSRLDFIYISG